MKHELVRLADRPRAGGAVQRGRAAGTESRFMARLLLKHVYGLSDEGWCERWVYDPYFQYSTGEEFFRHSFPHERSGLTHWRKRIGDKLEVLLQENLRVAHKGRHSDHANAVLTAVGYNFRLVLNWLRALVRKILLAALAAFAPGSALIPAS